MNVLFYNSDEYKRNYTPEQLSEEIWAAHIAEDCLFKCIVDFGYPQKMSIRIDELYGVPYCTIYIGHEEYEMLKHLCNSYVTFESEELFLEEE